ncbi:hypothetical protein JOF36_007064 [Pseudonocardia parietis]|uniref:Uncharacterized protein n=1 Tax=Pseudonocardia parietis TaxID=570936 RepID=A0ABS4W5M6_9PSEU|nr:hypothetical protein [Pseudonocardia parietis]
MTRTPGNRGNLRIEVKPRGQLKQDLISNYRAWAKRVGSGTATA